jgi:hypothetical protein
VEEEEISKGRNKIRVGVVVVMSICLALRIIIFV